MIASDRQSGQTSDGEIHTTTTRTSNWWREKGNEEVTRATNTTVIYSNLLNFPCLATSRIRLSDSRCCC